MQFRIPPQHKETVTIVRKLADENYTESTIATDVVCKIAPPRDSVNQRRNSLRVSGGVPIDQSDWTALLEKPNPDIKKGDFLKRTDGTEYRVEGVLEMKGSPVMQLQLSHKGVL